MRVRLYLSGFDQHGPGRPHALLGLVAPCCGGEEAEGSLASPFCGKRRAAVLAERRLLDSGALILFCMQMQACP